MTDRRDRFADKAETYENNAPRVLNVKTIAAAMLRKISFDKKQRIVDFGSGTGLLTEEIAPHVGHITAIDMSASMNAVLRKKMADFACDMEIIEMDLSRQSPKGASPEETAPGETSMTGMFDAIVSSMTIHHVEDIPALFRKFHAMLKPGGSIALADLDKEDGDFHKDNTGVFHFGFDQQKLLKQARDAGFRELQSEIVSVARKPYGDYPIFLLTGRK